MRRCGSVDAVGVAVLGRSEDVAQARLEFADGCVANLSASRVSFSGRAAPADAPVERARASRPSILARGPRNVVTPLRGGAGSGRYDYKSLSADEEAGFKDRVFGDILRVEPVEVESRNALLDELRDFVDSIRAAAPAARHRQRWPRRRGRGRSDPEVDRRTPMGRPGGRPGGSAGGARAVDSARSALAAAATRLRRAARSEAEGSSALAPASRQPGVRMPADRGAAPASRIYARSRSSNIARPNSMAIVE